MNANELMLGDWVKYHGVPVRIVEISEKSVGFMDGNAFDVDKPENLMPIPLTRDILVNNGFGSDISDDYYGEEIEVQLDLDEWEAEDDYGDAVMGFGKKIIHVHGLQHALRECGIEKEIVL